MYNRRSLLKYVPVLITVIPLVARAKENDVDTLADDLAAVLSKQRGGQWKITLDYDFILMNRRPD